MELCFAIHTCNSSIFTQPKFTSVLKDIVIALQAYGKAHTFIKQNKLWKWIIIPGVIYAILFVVGIYFFAATANEFFFWLKGLLESSFNKINSTLLGFLITFGSVLLFLMIMLLYFSLFKYFFLILGSPIFAYLSEKTEAIIEGKDYPFNFSQLLKDIIRGIRIALRNALWQMVYGVSILILSFVPIVGWPMPVFALIIEFYYYGFSMLDYSMERHKKTASESIIFIAHHKGLAIGNGMVFYLMHLVPFLGWIFAPAYAVIAATLSMHPLKENTRVQ